MPYFKPFYFFIFIFYLFYLNTTGRHENSYPKQTLAFSLTQNHAKVTQSIRKLSEKPVSNNIFQPLTTRLGHCKLGSSFNTVLLIVSTSSHQKFKNHIIIIINYN